MQALPAKSVGSFKPLLPGAAGMAPLRGSQPGSGSTGTPTSTSSQSTSTTSTMSTSASTPAPANSSFEQQNSMAAADSPHSAAPSPLLASQPSQPTVSHNGDPTMPTLSPHPPSKLEKDASSAAGAGVSQPAAASVPFSGPQRPEGSEAQLQVNGPVSQPPPQMNGSLEPGKMQQQQSQSQSQLPAAKAALDP